MSGGAAAGAAAAAVIASLNAESNRRRAVEDFQHQGDRINLAESMLEHYQGKLPGVPATVEEAIDRIKTLNQPEVMLADPWNRIVVKVIKHIAEQKQNDYENAQGLSRFLKAFSAPSNGALINEILPFFAGADRDRILARLKILENSGLIVYHDEIGEEFYSPTDWTYEHRYNEGFRLSKETKAFLKKEEGK